MSALFTDHYRRCRKCGVTAGVWGVNANGEAQCPSCGEWHDEKWNLAQLREGPHSCEPEETS